MLTPTRLTEEWLAALPQSQLMARIGQTAAMASHAHALFQPQSVAGQPRMEGVAGGFASVLYSFPLVAFLSQVLLV